MSSADEAYANRLLKEVAREVLTGDEPIRVDTRTMNGPVLRHLLSRAAHVHTMTGQCLVNRGGAVPVCADEFDWWKPRTD